MKVLLDNNVNHKFGGLITGHDVIHARTLGWAELHNGDLIAAAEANGFNVLVTVDKQMLHQQSLTQYKLTVVVLNSRLIVWKHIMPLAPKLQMALDAGLPEGTFITITPDS